MRDIKTEIINTTKQIRDLVDWLILRHPPPEPYQPTIYIDLEGVNLCREGSISILALLIDTGIPTICAYLIDVYSLGSQAFNTIGIKRKTLKDILQDEKIPKVFFDVRNDSDALFAHFGVALQGVEDIQLMESASRTTTSSRKYMNGLAKCIEQGVLYGSDLTSWKQAKENGARLFKPELGGSYEVFEQRPMPNEIISYCIGDVQYLPELWSRFRWKTYRWRDLVNEETKKRVEASQKPEYQPHTPERTLASWSKEQNRTLDEWNYVPPPRDDFEDDDWDFDGDEGWVDDGPTSCRDIINDCDYDYYYSD
jgi:exonuclease 3'-5' domain-containing protein 1